MLNTKRNVYIINIISGITMLTDLQTLRIRLISLESTCDFGDVGEVD